MVFFVVFIVLHLVKVIYCSTQIILVLIIVLVVLNRLVGIESNSRDGVFLATFFLLLLLAAIVLFFALSFYKKFYQITRVENEQFWSLDLKFFFSRVFYWLFLILSYNEVGWLRALRIVLVYIFSSISRP